MILHVRVPAALGAAGLLAVALAGPAPGQPPAAGPKPAAAAMKAPSLEEALAKARVNGKYAMLLRQFKAEQDAAQYKEFADVGLRDVRSHAGQDDLPRGHWVYVYPYWYIWRDLTAAPRPNRKWGPEQLIGEPDEELGKDTGKNWCSLTADGQDEWLLLEYAEPVVPTAVVVHANYAPGGVYRVTVFGLDGAEVEAWKGVDPTPPDEPGGVSVIPVKVGFKTNRVKVYIKSTEVPYWQEIDAVGLRDASGKTHWVTAAEASSTYAQQAESPVPAVTAVDAQLTQRLEKMEADIRELKQSQQEMKELLKEVRGLLKDRRPNP
jgi:hypothetical protein